MSIAPPTDIVLDVARAADPARYQEAAARLGQPGDPAAFTDAVHAASLALHMPLDARGTLTGLQNHTTLAGTAPGAADPYRKFEGMVLQQFIETMLPDKSETVFGKGNAGAIWKSMLAEQIGTQVAKSGGIGIARMLEAAHPGKAPQAAHPGKAEAAAVAPAPKV